MEDIIDGSPPASQRKRRNISKCHTSQKKSKRDVCNVENGIDVKTLDCSEQNSHVDQTKPNSLTRSDILRKVHMQEQANKASSQKVHTVKRCNNNRSESRLSTRAGFLSASQYSICASQSSSTQKFGDNCQRNSGVVVTSNCNTLLETQGFTESQFQIMDNDAKLNTIVNDEQKSISFDTTNISQKDNVVSTDSIQLGVTLSPDVNNRVIKNTNVDAVNASQNSGKIHRSIVESILNEWPTSPDKKNTPNQETQFSPKFKFDKNLILRTYLTKRRSPATASSCSAIGFNSSNEEIAPVHVNDEEVDPNTSVKIIDNIQNLSQLYSQSLTGTDVNETFKTVMDLKCQSLIKSSPSLEDEEDFFGFDNKSVTLAEHFYDFHSDTDDDVSNTSIIDQHHDEVADKNQHHDMLAEDDDIFVNFNLTQVNLSATKDDLFHEKLPTASRHSERNARTIALGEANNIFEYIENDYDLTRPNNCFRPPSASGLKHNFPSNVTTPTSGISHLPVSLASSSKQTNLFDNKVLGLSESPGNISSLPYAGFSTARGKQIPVSSTMISKKTNFFQNVEVTDDDLRNMNNWIDDNELDAENKVKSFSESPVTVSKNNITNFRPNGIGNHQNTLHIAGKNNFPDVVINEKTNQPNSAEFFREVTNALHPPQRETNVVPYRNMLMGKSDKSPINTFIKPSPLRKMSMVNSLRKLEIESLKENVDIHSKSNDTAYPPPSIQTPTSSKSYVCVTPTNQPKTLSQDCREASEFCLLDDVLNSAEDGTPGFIAEMNAQLIASSTPIRKTDTSLSRPKQTRLVERFDDLAGEDYFQTNVQSEPKIQISFDIISSRRKAFEKQQQSINDKTNIKPVPGTLYVNKLTAVKVKWKEFVDNSRPTTIENVLPNKASKLANNVLHVTTENATKFKFNGWDHYSDEFCRENENGIHLKDDIVVMMDENCQIGLKEISNAFLSCPSVDPKLIHDKWIKNNMKWIVIKLAGMERSFPHRFAGKVLTIENLMLQMKYRYEREIDHVERSAIRKICEMDDIPAKRMILFVAGITTNGHQCELELSDGWYSIMSTLDYEMRRLVCNGKINVGTKLVIQGAELENLENGYHPLDVPSNVRLKIYVNSTRRARWDAKLGYCKNPGPFKISLRSVQAFGGKLTKLLICVLRVYPVVYCDTKSRTGMQIHSEKVERRRSLKEERDRSIVVEQIFNQICKDFEDEVKADRDEHRPRKISKLSNISTITDPAVLCDLLDEDNDPECIENEMTPSQKAMVQNYKDKLNCSRRDEINNRLNAKLAVIDKNRGKFSPLLKFRIADELAFDKTAIVTISRPADEMFSMIQEGAVYEMTSAKTKGFDHSTNLMQIYAGRDTIFKKLYADRVPSVYCRHHTSISEILFIEQPVLNELDTVGFVVHVGDATTQLQPVYIADDHRNIVCIYFWSG